MAENKRDQRTRKKHLKQTLTTELPDDFEGMAAFESILSLIESSASVTPPQDFTRKVMQRLSETTTGSRQTSDSPSLSYRLKILIEHLTMPASTIEVATCFFLTGFFYLVLGISLHVGLKSISSATASTGWISYQPHIAILAAIGFAAVGGILLKNNRLAFRIANLAIICYILLSIFNLVQVQAIPASPFSLIGGLCFAAGTIMLGIFLAVTVNNFKRRTSPSSAGSP